MNDKSAKVEVEGSIESPALFRSTTHLFWLSSKSLGTSLDILQYRGYTEKLTFIYWHCHSCWALRPLWWRPLLMKDLLLPMLEVLQGNRLHFSFLQGTASVAEDCLTQERDPSYTHWMITIMTEWSGHGEPMRNNFMQGSSTPGIFMRSV